METYSSFQPATFMYFWLNYCDDHIERIPIAVQNIGHLFRLASQIIEADRLHLFLLSDDTRIDDNEYLVGLENGTELIVCTEEQIEKWSVYFKLKRYLRLRNISYPLNIDFLYDAWVLGKMPPGKVLPGNYPTEISPRGKLPPQNCPLENCPPGKLPPQQINEP